MRGGEEKGVSRSRNEGPSGGLTWPNFLHALGLIRTPLAI